MARAAGERGPPALSFASLCPNTGLRSRSAAWISGDNFVFHAALGEHQGIGPNQSQIADEFQNHAATQTAQQLAALVTPDPHHEVFIDLIHTDHVTLPLNVETTPWHLAIANAFHLHSVPSSRSQAWQGIGQRNKPAGRHSISIRSPSR